MGISGIQVLRKVTRREATGELVAFSFTTTMHRTGSSTAISMPSSPSLVVSSTTNDDDGDLSVPTSMSNASLSWDQLRRQARQVENEIELKLATLSKLGASVSSPPSHTTSPDSIAMNSMGKPSQELETEELLRKLQSIITSMGQVLDRPSATPTNPSMIHMLERHKDILLDYNKEFRRVKSNIKAAQDRANLMNQVQDEIRIFNTANESGSDYYLSERNRIEGSHRMTDMILEQAYATRQDIAHQGRMLRNINSRVGGVIGRIPGINNLISRINTRRKRDTLIMAGVISTCIILIMLYWLHT
ncbi:golgi snap receptor complex member 1 [Lichtheimia corymbifera JMRC:FSU:9682]|uniref:Golgi snap receptor complex member 1 n=1 Tax=Lichtheimia corymbifera JMRC:FSU:9682 TaxID=1263082 RepID=A0A068S2F6_9FUNG|nr:golgi snap receptor complex member 1 [Lichtheimia corymbifera JMRC:FSU:9682]